MEGQTRWSLLCQAHGCFNFVTNYKIRQGNYDFFFPPSLCPWMSAVVCDIASRKMGGEKEKRSAQTL